MIVMDERPELKVRSTNKSELQVDRTDISFYDLDQDKVRVQVTVHNTGEHRSSPTPMRLESAPLGAFVAWQPLGSLMVPALEPGESRELTLDVARPRPAPLGDFNRLPPKSLVTAINSPDQPSRRPRSGFVALLNLLRQQPATPSSDKDVSRNAQLAPDLYELAGRGQPHWAGNINVFVGNCPVERHLARALRVYPGRTNLAMFVVGESSSYDAYAFELVGLARDWRADLYNATNNSTLLPNPVDLPIEETTQWVESNGTLLVMLAAYPPVDCRTGNLEVHVTRRSSGTTAIVEFNLDPAAQGTGCYFV
jgi:hypothetical protein